MLKVVVSVWVQDKTAQLRQVYHFLCVITHTHTVCNSKIFGGGGQERRHSESVNGVRETVTEPQKPADASKRLQHNQCFAFLCPPRV